MSRRTHGLAAALLVTVLLLMTGVALGQDAPATPADTAYVVLLIDISDSMYGPPLINAKAAAREFLRTVDPTTHVALMTFGTRVTTVTPFTTDYERLSVDVGSLLLGGVTALYQGAAQAVEVAMTAPTGQRAVIVLADGPEYGGASRARRGDAAELAAANNITVHTVALGNWADMPYLQALAAASGGTMFNAPTSEDLSGVYVSIAERVNAMAPLVVPEVPLSAPALVENDPAARPAAAQAQVVVVQVPVQATAAPVVENLAQVLAAATQEIAPVDIEAGAQSVAAGENIQDALRPATANDPRAALPNVPVGDMGQLLALRVGEQAAPDALVQPEAGDPALLGTGAMAGTAPGINLGAGVYTISVALDGSAEVDMAEIALNGISLGAYIQAPFEAVLDTARLREGLYTLAFTMRTRQGVTSAGTLELEVVPDVNAAPVVAGASPGTPLRVLVDGVDRPLSFTFSTDEGLRPTTVAADAVAASGQAPSVWDILRRPTANLLPQPVMAVLGGDHRTFATVVILIVTATLLPQGLFTLYWMLYTWNNPRAAQQYASPTVFTDPAFSFTALVPARKEDTVIYQTIQSVAAMNYPAHMREVLVLIRDEDDDATIAEARRAIADIGDPNVRLVTFTDGPKNKPNGLNKGLLQARGDVVCIFDAEDQPHPDLYNVVNTVMLRDNAEVVQSGVQLMNLTSNWFAAFNVLEYFFWFKSGLHCYTREFRTTPLGGNTVFFRREWLQRTNGWSLDCLTEDAYIGLQLTRMGANIQIVYSPEHATQEETPSTPSEFIKQRTRWNQGFYDIFLRGEWLRLPTLRQRVTAVYILLNSLLQAATVLYLPLGIWIALTQTLPVPVALLSFAPIYVLLMQLVVNLMGIAEFAAAYNKPLPWLFRLRMIIFFYPYQLLLAAGALRAVGRMITRQNSWEKTAHSNLHREPAGSVEVVAARS